MGAPSSPRKNRASQAPPAPAPRPEVRFRLRITCGDQVAVGPGKIALLEAIERTGSITAAAKSLDMSYRRAWMLIDQLNRSLRSPAVGTATGGSRGGGSTLTDEGRRVVALYRRIERTAERCAGDDLDALLGMLAGPVADASGV